MNTAALKKTGSASVDADTVKKFKESIRGALITPQDPSYDTVCCMFDISWYTGPAGGAYANFYDGRRARKSKGFLPGQLLPANQNKK